MESLAQRIQRCDVPRGSVAVFWLGQAGFLLKTDRGKRIVIDPYLSDCCHRYVGFRRLMPMLIEPSEVQADIVIASHAHYDHFDVDAMPVLISNPNTVLVTAPDGKSECTRLHLPETQIRYLACGDSWTYGEPRDGIRIQAVPCDHGALAPEAIGLWITVSGKTIYFTGDTAWRPDLFSNPALAGPDVLILPINGAFGNLNEAEAAQAAAVLKPGCVLPCHFWKFAEHGGDPGKFTRAMEQYVPEVTADILPMGGMRMV